MPYNVLNLQLFGEDGGAMVGADTGSSGLATTAAENPGSEGVATGTPGEQIAPAGVDQTPPTIEEESWDSLIKGKYKKDYDKAVKAAVNKRFKNQQDLQRQIDSIDPIVRAMAERYGVLANPDGSIPIDQLQAKLDNDNSLYEKEAFERGIPVEDLKQLKRLERENQSLKRESQQRTRDQQWQQVLAQAEQAKQFYPELDLEAELQNPNFGRLLTTMQSSGFPNAVQLAYETVHRDEIMGGAMRHAVVQTQQKISNSIQSGMSRPIENGAGQQSAAQVGAVDPSKLTKAQIDDINRRAARGERITF